MLYARIHQSQLPRLASLRAAADIEAAGSDETVWLRGGERLRGIPHLELAVANAEGELFLEGGRVPYARLPADLDWQALHHLVHIKPASSVLPGQVVEAAAGLRVVRSERWRPPAILLTSVEAFHEASESMSQPEIDRFSFAMNDAGEVLVRGNDLPPIQGTVHTVEGGIALPLGFDISPRLDASVLAATFGLEQDDLALYRDGAWELVRAVDWVAASRSAIRLSHNPNLQPPG